MRRALRDCFCYALIEREYCSVGYLIDHWPLFLQWFDEAFEGYLREVDVDAIANSVELLIELWELDTDNLQKSFPHHLDQYQRPESRDVTDDMPPFMINPEEYFT